MKAKVYLGSVLIGIFLYQTINLIFSSNIIQFTPDDSFYYLLLGKNYALLGQWSIDGVHVTNGFHPLWGYIIAATYWLTRASIDNFPIIMQSISITVVAGTVLYIIKNEKNEATLWLAYIATMPLFIEQSISNMEWFLIPICAYCVITGRHRYLFTALGILARVDFAILPIIVFIIERLVNKRIDFKLSVTILITVIGISIHNYIAAGTFLQANATIKADWYKYYNPELLQEKAFALSSSFFYANNYTTKLMVFLCIIGGAIYLLNWNRFNTSKTAKVERKEILISLLTIIGYTAINWRNAGVMLWYTGMMVIPIFIIGKYAVQKFKPLLIPAILGIAFNLFQTTYEPLYPQQAAVKEVGKLMAKVEFDGKVGAWSAGIINYYSEKSITNLDGLVNNSIHPYILNNRVSEYLKKEDIKYVIDFANMWRPPYPKQGGYENQEWIAKIKLRTIAEVPNCWWRYFVIAEVPL